MNLLPGCGLNELQAASAPIPLLHPLVAESADLLSRLRPQANTEWSSLLAMLAMLALVAAIVLLIAHCVARYERQQRMSPRRLFQELCQAHQLSWSQRQLLTRLADAQKMTSPCQLFLDRTAFDNLGPALQPYQAQYTDLRRRLFQ